MMTEVQGADATFDFFKDLPKDESTREELAAFKKDWVSAGGLVWASTMPAMLGVSRQRWHQMKSEGFTFKIYRHFDKEFISFQQAVEFEKLHRPSGTRNAAKAIKDMMVDANSE